MNPLKELHGRTRIVSLACLVVTACALACPAHCQSPPPPAPVLTNVYPDRVAQGDLITLTGSHLVPDGSSPSAYVTFNPNIQVFVNPSSESQISVIVPQGAMDGPVTVTTSCVVDGKAYTQTSNPANILVMWKTIAASPYFRYFLPGMDDKVLYVVGYYGIYVYSMDHSGAVSVIAAFPGSTVSVARDPATGRFAYIYWNGSTGLWRIVDEAYGRQLDADCAYGGDYCGEPFQLAFDGNGNLYLSAFHYYSGGATMGLWRFGPSDFLTMDPNAPASLVHGGLPEGFGFGGWPFPKLAVSPDGKAYCLAFQFNNVNDYWFMPFMVRYTPGASACDIVPLPLGHCCGSDDQVLWSVSTDCMGHAFVLHEVADPPGIYDMNTGEIIGMEDLLSAKIGTDAYGNILVYGRDPITYESIIKRVEVSDLTNPHYYDNFDCCATRSTLRAANKTVAPANVGVNPIACGIAEIDITQGGQTVKITGDGQTVTLPLGATPSLALLSGGQPVRATWSLKDQTRDNTADPDDLFCSDVGLLFQPPSPSAAAGLAVLHMGHMEITAQAGSTSLSFNVCTSDSVPLGSRAPEVDGAVYSNAERFGIPPQFIKGIIEKESTFTPRLTREEPRTWDYGEGQRSGFRQRLTDPVMARFAFQEPAIAGVPGSPISEGSLVAAWKDERLYCRYGLSLLYSWSVWNYGQGCTGVSYEDDAIQAYAMCLGSDKWGNAVPPGSPYRTGPCGIGWDWFDPVHVSVWIFDQLKPSGCAPREAALDFFYNNLGYNAQTALSASYGYMQLSFDTLNELHWLDQANPTPEALEATETNIGLGSKWLAWKRKYLPRYYGGSGRASLSDLQHYFIWLCTLFNGSQNKGTGYGQEVVNTLAPAYQPWIATGTVRRKP